MASNNNKDSAPPAKAKAADGAASDKAKKVKPAQAAKPAKQGGKAVKEQQSGGPAQWWEQGVQFLREARAELKKVAWPSRKQTVASTSVVVVLVAIVSLFLGMVDYILSHIVGYVIG